MVLSSSTQALFRLFIVVLLSSLARAQWIIDDEDVSCRTPDNSLGSCISLSSCNPILDVLKTIKRPVSAAITKKLQSYTCGSDSVGVKVCCPFGPITLEATSGPPDVSRHRNLNLLPESCGYLDTDNRIVNGEDAAMNEFPWMALLKYGGRSKSGFKCGGSIINKNYILTAAHCITNLNTSSLISIRVGEHSIKNTTDCEVQRNKRVKCNPPVQDLSIEEIIPHPGFSPQGFTNDIGLVRVSTINLKLESTRPVCLPITESQRTATYANVIVTGWGVTNPETGDTSDILQKVRLPVADKAECTKLYGSHKITLYDYQQCAGGVKNRDSCSGDSGGPMVIPIASEDGDAQYIQQGVVSFGNRYCGVVGYPGIYTLVKYYMDWILNTLKP